MKTFTMQRIFLGTSIITGVLVTGGLYVGLVLLGNSAFHWRQVVALGGIFTLLFALVQGLVVARWILPVLKYCRQMTGSPGESLEEMSQKIRITELAQLVRTLRDQAEYSKLIAQLTHDMLDQGSHQDVKLRSEVDPVGTAFQRLVSTLHTLEDLLEELTQGNLQVRVPDTVRQTKIGKMFRLMVIGIRQAVIKSRRDAQKIAISSARIASMSQQGSHNTEMESGAVESISSSIQEVAANLRQIMHNMKSQVQSLDTVFEAVESITQSIRDMNDGVEALSALAEATTQSIEEIHDFTKQIENHAQSAAQISETVSTEAKEGLTSVGSVIAGTYIIKSTVEEAAEAIQRLGNESERIGDILNVINDVTDQTNLLALNASIIAAQAGEHGRGFSVVAEQIKELAQRTNVSTKEIADIIRSVQTEVAQGMDAIQNCLQSVDEGVGLANQSGEVLKKIVRSIQGTKKMISTIASATITQAENSQHVKNSTEQVNQQLEALDALVKHQTTESAQILDMAHSLNHLTQEIDQAAVTQLQATEAIVQAVEQIQRLIRKNAVVAHQLAGSSLELGKLESDLAENMGQFLVTKRRIPPGFDPQRPTVAFIYPGAPSFFSHVHQGIQKALDSEQFQSLTLDSQEDPVLQTEHLNWLLRQQWLRGIILTPVDEQTGQNLVATMLKSEIPVVAVDRVIKNVRISVVADNLRGGAEAAQLLKEELPEQCTVLVFGTRSINSLCLRMEGFAQKAKTYSWKVIEVFVTPIDMNRARQSILQGCAENPDAAGIFLTHEHASLAYLALLNAGQISQQQIRAVSYDVSPEITEAVADGRFLGTIDQNPFQLGYTAAQELMALLQQPQTEPSASAKEILIPVNTITRQTLPGDL